MLEGSEHSMNRRGMSRQSSKQEDEENSEIKSLLNDAIIDNEEQYNMKLVHRKLQEERLYNLSKIPAGLPILSTELDNPIDQQLGGIEEIQQDILHSYSSSSSTNGNSTSSISTVTSSPNTNKGQEQANKILHKIHGKKRISNTHYQKRNIYPNCPNCSNQLIYLYLHHTTTTSCPTVPKLTTSHLHSGTQYNSKSTKYKLQNILPPKCLECNIYYIYDYISSVYKDIMIDNMMRWLEEVAESDVVTDDNGTYVNEHGVVVDGNKYPRCSKLVVINSTPKSGDDANTEEKKKRGFHETMQITTSFQQRPRSNLTPRPQHERQNSRVSFKFDNDDCPVFTRDNNGEEGEEMEMEVVSPRPLFSPRNDAGGTIFSGLSSLTEQPQQREGGDDNMEVKKSLSDEDPFTDISCNGNDDEIDMDDEEKDDDDDDNEDGDSCGSISQWLPNSVEEKDTCGKEADDKENEEDNIQDIDLEDEKIPLAPPPPPQADNDEREDEEMVIKQTQNQDQSQASSSPNVITHGEPVSSPTLDTSSIKSSESNNNDIKLIHTDSEERMILEKYSLKKEIATRQIAKDLIGGHELTTLECQRCKMPMTKMKDNEGKLVECTTCQAVKRNAKRTARRKRSKLSIRSGAASVDEDDEPHQILSPGSILSQEVRKIPPPPDKSKLIDRADHTNLFYFHPDDQAADGTTTLPVSEKEEWLAALAIPVGGSKDKLDLSRHSHSTSLHHPESISEVSEYSKQVLGSSSSDESSTRCPRTLPDSEMTYQPYYFSVVEEREGVVGAQLDHAYTGSISEVSEYNERPLVSNDQQQKDITTVDILIGLSSDESMTKCPRDLPPSDMIWDSQPTPSATVYPVQSIASGDHQQAIKSTDDNLRRIATSQEKATQGPTLLTPFDLQNVEDDHNKVDTKLNSEVDTEDDSVVSGEKGDASALLQASLSPSNLNERIARLADSLREVASQLPKDGIVKSEPKQPHPSSDDTKLEEEDIMQNDMLSVLEEEEEDSSCQVPHIHQRTFSPIQQPVNEYQIEEEIVNQQTSRHRSPLHRLQSAPLAISPYTFQPIPLRSNSVGNNGHGISISPINVRRDEKQFDLFSSDNDDEGEEEVIVHPSPKKIQRCDHTKTLQACVPTSPPHQEDRADPPGRRRVDEIRDPPENDLTTNDDHNHTAHSPSSKGISSKNLTQVSEKNQSGRDPPPSTTPSRGRRRKRLIAACNDDDATEEKLVREMKVAASRPDFIHRNKPINKSDRGTLSLDVDDDAYSEIDAPIQSTKSSGSMNELFQQIDDLEIDFQRTIASMPGSEGMSMASLKSYSNDNHSLVEITINNGINSICSFDSENHTEEEDSLVSEAVESMRKIKDCLARVESVDEEDDCRSDIDTVSQCESETMTVLIDRLAKTVGELL